MKPIYFYGTHQLLDATHYDCYVNVANQGFSPFAGGGYVPSFTLGANNPPSSFLTIKDAYQYAYNESGDITVAGINTFLGVSDYVNGGLIDFPLEIDQEFHKKLNIPTGTTSQYIRGDGTLAAFPTVGNTPQTHITDAVTNSPTNAETNAPTNSKTDYNVLTTLLGTLTDGLNATNTAQNTIATKLNANAVKQNTLATNVNAGFTKMNAILDALEANSILAA